MTHFSTTVAEVPATPMGLLPARWVIWHVCRECRADVKPDELLAHAKEHERCLDSGSFDSDDWSLRGGGDIA